MSDSQLFGLVKNQRKKWKNFGGVSLAKKRKAPLNEGLNN